MKKIRRPINENERLLALNNYDIIDSLAEQEFDRIAELASLLCDTPIALISISDKDRQWFKSKIGLEATEISRANSFCEYAVLDNDIFEVQDALNDERFRENSLVIAAPDIRFYAGQPLIDPDGYAIGTLCVLDNKPRSLSSNQKKALQLLAEEVVNLIIDRRQKAELKNFESIFQLSNDLICIVGTDGFFKKINPAFEKILGLDDALLSEISFFSLIHPDDLALSKAEVVRLAAGLSTVNFSHRFKVKDNAYRVLHWVATLEPHTGNLFAIGRDITEDKLKEQYLIVSEARTRAFFDHSQGFMCTHDLEGKFLSVNNAGASILGYQREEILQMSLFDIVPAQRHEYLKAYLQRISTERLDKGQMVTLTRDGAVKIWMYNNVLEHDHEGKPYIIGNAVDITERHYLEEDLKKTKEALEQSNRMARVGGWEFNVVQQKIVWSSVTKEIHGVDDRFQPDLATAINFYKEGKGREIISEAIKSAIDNGEPWDLELQICTAQGKELWVRSLGYAEFENDICKRLYGTFQDIDKEKMIALEVSASRKLFNDVLQAASEISIIASDPNGIITVFNKGAEKLLAYTAEEILGKETPAIFHSMEEVAARGKELSNEYAMPIEGFRVFVHKAELLGSDQGQWTYIRKDGEERKVTLVITPINGLNNEIIGYLGIATDITERLQIERELLLEKSRLSAFVEHAPAAVAMLDNEMKYISVSNRWLEDYRLNGRDIIGASHYDIFENVGAESRARHQRILAGSIERKEEDTFRLPGSPSDEYVTWEMRPWYQYDGQVGGLMIFTQNITSIILQREELLAAKKNAEKANAAKSEFLANMSHEIRTPLNGVIGFTDLVLKTNLDDVQQQYLSIVMESSNALLSIINDILDFSKIEAGKLELDIEKFDIYELASQAADIITYQAQTKGLEMLLNIPPELPRFVYADSMRLKQILVNLLGNASKFTEKGEIELSIEIIAATDKETNLRFSVRDTGIGIKQDKQVKIFDAFSQEDSSTTKRYGGTGLGLTISNRLLSLMGSRLQLHSEAGKGSTFYFDVTFVSEQGDPIDWVNLELINTVLVVDDNDNNRLIVKRMLLLKNIEVTEARNGFEALQLLAEGRHYDVILMDYHMPYMDGIETIRKIRESFYPLDSRQPLILLHSSSDDAKIIKACDELEVNLRIIKPIKMRDIYHALSRLYHKEKIAPIPELIEEQNPSRFKILIAEDNAINLLLAKAIIKKIAPDAAIQEAVNGLEAVEFCTKETPDLILMDIQMPEMNGYDATAKIRELNSGIHIPIVALTAGNVLGEREKCLASGMDDFIVKPIIEETIIAIFRKWLNADPDWKNKVETDSTMHFNYNRIKSYVGNDAAVLQELITLLKIELVDMTAELEQHVQDKSLEEINKLGHKIYGVAVSSGLLILSKMAKELELLEDFDSEKINNALLLLKNEVDIILRIVNARSAFE